MNCIILDEVYARVYTTVWGLNFILIVGHPCNIVKDSNFSNWPKVFRSWFWV